MEKLLIVEDDETIRFGLKYYLEQEEFDIYQAGTVKEALEKFSKNQLNLVLLDLNLPDGKGFDLYKSMKALKDVPTIFFNS